MKEVRNANLIATVRTKLPNVGNVNLDTNSSGRRLFFTFRSMDFLVSSRLKVKELGFGRMKADNTNDSPDAVMLETRLNA